MNININMNTSDVIKNFTISGSEAELKDVLSKLLFIASLRPGEKFNPHTLQIRETGYITSALRTFNPVESKEGSYAFIENTINRGTKLFHYYSSLGNEFNQSLVTEIKKALEESKKGIDSQIDTYKYNREYTSKLESLKKMVDLKLQGSFNNQPVPPPPPC